MILLKINYNKALLPLEEKALSLDKWGLTGAYAHLYKFEGELQAGFAAPSNIEKQGDRAD